MGFSLSDLTSLNDLDSNLAGISSGSIPVTALGQGDTIEQAKGTTRRYMVTLADPESALTLSGVYLSTTALRAFAWEGMDGPTLATPTVSWDDATAGTVLLDLYPVDLAGLAEQPYPIRIEVDRGGQWQEAWDGWIDVLPEPATTVSPRVYGTYRDMVGKGGAAIRQLLTADEGAGFLRSRAEAATYLHQIILARYRPPGGRWGNFGYSSGIFGYSTSLDTPNQIIKGYLDAGYLMKTDLVVELVTRKALALLFDRQQDDVWRKRAGVEHLRADWLAASLVACIDLNGDGYAEISINCGIINTRNI